MQTVNIDLKMYVYGVRRSLVAARYVDVLLLEPAEFVCCLFGGGIFIILSNASNQTHASPSNCTISCDDPCMAVIEGIDEGTRE